MAHVIVVANESEQQDAVTRYLTLVGVTVSRAKSGQELDRLLAEFPPDLLIIDTNLAGEDGLSIVTRLRSTSRIGILVLTTQNNLDDRILGLLAGADACLAKPVQLRELEAMIRSLLRRLKNIPPHRKRKPGATGWTFNARDWTLISPNGGTVPLTNAEYRVLQILIAQPGVSVMREKIATCLGKRIGDYGDRSIDAIFSRLRRKVMTASGEQLPVRAARGTGYAFTAFIEPHHNPIAAIA